MNLGLAPLWFWPTVILGIGATLLTMHYGPLGLLNRVLRRLGVPYSVWRLRGHWFVFRDEPGSLTPIIVAGEIRRGLYDVKLRPGDGVVDLGAHVGMFSIPLARLNPRVAFTAYEPNPVNYANLQRNITLNRAWNVRAINAGLSGQPGFLASEAIGWNTGGSRTTPASKGVPGLTIKTILGQHNPSVLKVDVEGGEFGAIQGNDLAGVECVIMEVHGHLGDPAPVLAAAKKAGSYLVQVIDCPSEGIYVQGGKFPPKTSFSVSPATAGRIPEAV